MPLILDIYALDKNITLSMGSLSCLLNCIVHIFHVKRLEHIGVISALYKKTIIIINNNNNKIIM